MKGAVGAGRLAGFIEQFQEWFDDVDRHQENHGGVLFGGDICKCSQIMQLRRRRHAAENLCLVDNGLRHLELGAAMDDLSVPVAFRLGLFCRWHAPYCR